jgi:predicted metal-dependent peptidase
MTKVTDNEALDRIIAARTTLILEHPFYGSIALRLKLVEDLGCATMWTDAVRMGYSPAFVKTLSDPELVFVVAHEATHCVAGHSWRRGGREPRKFNVAADLAINPVLRAGGLTMPGCGLDDKKFHGMSAEAIYDKIPAPPPQGGGGQGKGKGGKANQPGPGEALDEVRDAENPQEAEADWKVAAVQAVKIAKMMGNLPAGIEDYVEKLVKPKLPWRDLLRRFAHTVKHSDYDWRRPNRRYTDIYLPSMRSEAVPPMVVVIDVSGSTSDYQEQFGSEMKAIVEDVLPETTHVLYCDTRVSKPVDVFERGEFVLKIKRGSGGTSFIPPFTWVEEEGLEPACLIYLTDLEGNFPDSPPPYPVLWVSTTNEVAPWGDTIQIEKDD